MMDQEHISAATPMGAGLVASGGATFRVWAPRASAVYLNGVFGGVLAAAQTPEWLMAKDAKGYWTGFHPTANDGDLYHFWISGPGSAGYKRDPYARELAQDEAFPNDCCYVRSTAYPWHDAAFVTPDFTNMIVYQIHIGTYAVPAPGVSSGFLDVIGKIPYLVALGINVLQPLPVDETQTRPSMGYDGADLFSPDFPYVITDAKALAGYLAMINGLLDAKGQARLALSDIDSGSGQLKAMIDLCHVYGIAVALDVVYNHAGGFSVSNHLDDGCLYFMDRMPMGNQNDSLYFTDQDRGTGGLSFALWNEAVRQFLLDNALYYVKEYHADGFRFDEISTLLSCNKDSGWSFCRDLTGTLKYVKPRLLLNAEYWQGEFGDYPKTAPQIVTATADGGAGFDVVQHDGLRGALRTAVQAAAGGAGGAVDMSAIAAKLYPQGFAHGWQTIPCIENHDLVMVGRSPRVPALADPSNPRSWYARSRTRVAMGILLTAPGIPQLFMGQEFLEDKPWDTNPDGANLLWWDWLLTGQDRAMVDHLRFTRELIALRWRYQALREDNVNAFKVHNGDRVLAYHRWLDGQDVVVVATLAEATWRGYGIGFPGGGHWVEVFNSDVYDGWVNPQCAGNAGGVEADGPGLDGMPASAQVVIPANGFVVFARG